MTTCIEQWDEWMASVAVRYGPYGHTVAHHLEAAGGNIDHTGSVGIVQQQFMNQILSSPHPQQDEIELEVLDRLEWRRQQDVIRSQYTEWTGKWLMDRLGVNRRRGGAQSRVQSRTQSRAQHFTPTGNTTHPRERRVERRRQGVRQESREYVWLD
jgi:hypothetical protein